MVAYDIAGSTNMTVEPVRQHQRNKQEVVPKQDSVVSLIHLLNQEVRTKKLEKPVLQYGHAGQAKKGEDFVLVKTDCERIPGDGSSTFGVFAIFDGHNGAAAAIYTKENLLNDVMSAVPSGLGKEEWLAMLPRALVAGFVKTDKEFQRKEQSSGTTVTFVIIDGWTVTVASVGDSRCILDSEGGITTLTVDHRLESNVEERERVSASGGEVGRLSTVGGAEIGPLRCWPGGLCLSRSIGDMDVGEFIVPVPFVKQIKLPLSGGRLIIASDGVWDALNCEKAVQCCRGLPIEIAAKQVVKEALRSRGLRDDTTCLVVDIVPPCAPLPLPAPATRKPNKILRAFSFKKQAQNSSSKSQGTSELGKVVEIFEEGSAMLAERLGSRFLFCGDQDSCVCAICQTSLTREEGIPLHVGSIFTGSPGLCQGPLLCVSCKEKKDAMEGKSNNRPEPMAW